ncbi:hypothetical protein D3C73_1310730 [compost metagenome]
MAISAIPSGMENVTNDAEGSPYRRKTIQIASPANDAVRVFVAANREPNALTGSHSPITALPA